MRTHRTPEEWRTLFDEQQRSGLNKTQFCRQHGITRSAFSNARHRLSARCVPTSAFISALPPTQDIEKTRPTNISDANEPTA
ncbi:IS66 family insertion sequence element accessory protein TnpA, partial [Enterobacter asburiae]